MRDDACFIFSPVWRGTSTHARLATRASWARFSTSATVRTRFARARGLPSVGTRSGRRSPETLFNFPRRRPPPPNRATDDRGRATLTPSPAPLSLTPQPPRFTWAPRLPSVWVLVSSRAPRGRYASTPRVTSASPHPPRASLSRARRAKNIAGRRAGAPVHRLAPRRTPPDPPQPRALPRRTGTGPPARPSRTTTRTTDPAAIGRRRRRRRRGSCTLSQRSASPTRRRGRDATPRRAASPLKSPRSRVYSTHIARAPPPEPRASRSPMTREGETRRAPTSRV